MATELEKTQMKAMYRRWLYMAIAIVAAALLPVKPMFSFEDDKGIKYIRSFSMDQHSIVVTQTELSSGAKQVTATMSVKGLHYCYKIMLWGSILCFLCFFSRKWRIRICEVVVGVSGVYYVLLVYYALRIADTQYATLSPSLAAVLPAIVLSMMLQTRHNVVQSEIADTDGE